MTEKDKAQSTGQETTQRDMQKGTRRDRQKGTRRDIQKGTRRDMQKDTESDMQKGTERDMQKGTQRDMQKGTPRQTRQNTQKYMQRKMALVIVIDLLLAAAVLVTGTLVFARWYHEKNRPVLSELRAPDWYTQDFLKVNPYSRPGTKREEINDIVIHYVANPGTTAQQNLNYFNSLANQKGKGTASVSSHYIIGMDGEILQAIPLDEIAYANYPRNKDTVSIELCHPDETGAFTEETRESLVKLVAWLCDQLNLTEKNVIRHYDVIGKNCPKYYVEHEDAWEELLADIKKKRKES